MLSEIGLIAADTSRTRAYLAALERHSLLPAWTLLLDDNTQVAMHGQVVDSTMLSSTLPDRATCWSEADFNPAEPLEPWLQRLGLAYTRAESRDINAPGVVKFIAQSSPSVLIYSGYGGALLRREVLACGKRFLHAHGGYLPDFKGSTTNYYSLLADNSLGASALFLTAEIDSGPVLTRRRFPPPCERTAIDHRYDAAARARVLIDTLLEYRARGEWHFDLPDNRGGFTYYIIHPVLKHLAILGNAVTD